MSKKSRFLFDNFQKAIAIAKKHSKESAEKIEEEVNQFLEPKKSKFFKLQKKKRKSNKPMKFKKGLDPKMIARRLNGAKGGNKTAALYNLETRRKWGHKAGTATLQRYGKDYFRHIRKNRKDYKQKKRVKV